MTNFKNGIAQKELMRYLIIKQDLKAEPFAVATIERIIDYAGITQMRTKDKAAYFLSDTIPELEFYEAAAFVSDDFLTAEGMKEKARFWELHTMFCYDLERIPSTEGGAI